MPAHTEDEFTELRTITRWTASRGTWRSPSWSWRMFSILLVAPLSKYQNTGKMNSQKRGPKAGCFPSLTELKNIWEVQTLNISKKKIIRDHIEKSGEILLISASSETHIELLPELQSETKILSQWKIIQPLPDSSGKTFNINISMNSSSMCAGILIKVRQVILITFSMIMMDSPMSLSLLAVHLVMVLILVNSSYMCAGILIKVRQIIKITFSMIMMDSWCPSTRCPPGNCHHFGEFIFDVSWHFDKGATSNNDNILHYHDGLPHMPLLAVHLVMVLISVNSFSMGAGILIKVR